MGQRMAIVDCGTNTFNILIAEQSDKGDWETLFSNKWPVKIGEGGFEDRQITDARMAKGLDALHYYYSIVQAYQVGKVHVFATSALRDARNTDVFKSHVKSLTNWDISVIDGDEEAQLIYEGVQQTMDLHEVPTLLMDIGGGSTEFIITTAEGIVFKQSTQLGISRIFEQVPLMDRAQKSELNQIKQIFDLDTKELKDALTRYPCQRLVGASGSFDTLLELYYYTNKKEKIWSNHSAQEIPVEAFASIYMFMMGSSYADRLKHPAIPNLRVQFMPIAVYLMKLVLDLQPFNQIYRSPYALKEGVLKRLQSR
jgi:exopolyphosphatase/guanosine-5'-triphosphate,3'-diphosphate pyrophosphatase